MKKTLPFKAEISQLMDLVINSLYQNREVFLRELVSNATDACERLRFLAISDPKLISGNEDLRIRVSIDKEAKTITIEDNGVGMDEEDVVNNLGRVASSGTRRFLEQMREQAPKGGEGEAGKSGFDSFIGKFGVGFYAAFLVADHVELLTRKAGDSADKGVLFSTDGRSKYTIEQARRPGNGTEVRLHIKEECEDYLESHRLAELAHSYSGNVSFPLHLPASGGAVVSGSKDSTDDSGASDYQVINPSPALWMRPAKDITENEYKELYRNIGASLDDPLTWLHCQIEGTTEYRALLYVPSSQPPQLFERDFHGRVKLYIRRVFVSLEHKLLPDWLNFLIGVIEAPHLTMNISREALQHDKGIASIRKSLVKKIIDHFTKLAKKDPKAWQALYDQFAIPIKQGAIVESGHRDALTALLRFHSSRSDEATSLDDYLSRAPKDQKALYYLTAPDLPTAKSSPYLEALNQKGIEALLCVDPVDEWLIHHLSEYRDRPFKAVHKGELSLDEDKPEEASGEAKGADEGDSKDLIRRLRLALEARVKEVRSSKRLFESPACLVSEGNDLSLHTKDALRQYGQPVSDTLPDLEINLGHPIIEKLGKTDQDSEFQRLAEVIYDVCRLSAVGRLENPAESARRITSLLSDTIA